VTLIRRLLAGHRRWTLDRGSDVVRSLPVIDEEQVLEANREFYRAFRERDYAGMERVWSREHIVACLHPGWEPLTGRARVMQSWEAILSASSSPPVKPAEEHVLSTSADSAFVVCAELIDDVKLVATNVFAKEAGGWRLVHHHASPLARNRPKPPDSSELN
jgi:ketosteroid isomerase-like protein